MKSGFLDQTKPLGILPGVFALFLLLSQNEAVGGYLEDKQAFEEKKQRELERMEAREEEAQRRSSQKREECATQTEQCIIRLYAIRNVFNSVSELKRVHDSVFETKLDGEIASQAVRIRGELARIERELSYLKSSATSGIGVAATLSADVATADAKLRRLEVDVPKWANNAYLTSGKVLQDKLAQCKGKFADIAEKTVCLGWNDESGLSCLLEDEMSNAEKTILSTWKEFRAMLRNVRGCEPAFTLDGDFGSPWDSGMSDSRTGQYIKELQAIGTFLPKMQELEQLAEDNSEAWKRKKNELEEKRRKEEEMRAEEQRRREEEREEERRRREEERAEREAEWERKMSGIPPLIRRKSLFNRPFKVFQIFDDGQALCVDLSSGSIFSLRFSHKDNRSVVDGDEFRQDLYWCGTYSYTTVKSAPKRVNLFAIDLEVAIREAERQGYDLYE